MNLYDENGYLRIDLILRTKLPFLFVCGGRATGKTYGSLKYVIENDVKFILMRRTQSQLDLINKPEFSPFKAVCSDIGIDIGSVSLSKYNVGFYRMEISDQGKALPVGEPLGYSMALSTISNMRGFDASDVKLLIYDEFIPERHERPIKNEGAAFLNAIETIGRNRELKGEDPLQVLCLANANDLGNPIFQEMGLIGKAEAMKRKGQTMSLDYQRGIGLFLLDDSPISEKKRQTALYKAAEASEFEQMALDNDFAEMKTDSVRVLPLKEFTVICTLGELCFYKHKSEKGLYYCSMLTVGTPEIYTSSETDIKRWCRKYPYIWAAYMRNKLVFESVTCEVVFNHYVD